MRRFISPVGDAFNPIDRAIVNLHIGRTDTIEAENYNTLTDAIAAARLKVVQIYNDTTALNRIVVRCPHASRYVITESLRLTDHVVLDLNYSTVVVHSSITNGFILDPVVGHARRTGIINGKIELTANNQRGIYIYGSNLATDFLYESQFRNLVIEGQTTPLLTGTKGIYFRYGAFSNIFDNVTCNLMEQAVYLGGICNANTFVSCALRNHSSSTKHIVEVCGGIGNLWAGGSIENGGRLLYVHRDDILASGYHDGAGNVQTLADSTKSWTADEFNGKYLWNRKNRSKAIVYDTTATTIVPGIAASQIMAGSPWENDWDAYDPYWVTTYEATIWGVYFYGVYFEPAVARDFQQGDETYALNTEITLEAGNVLFEGCFFNESATMITGMGHYRFFNNWFSNYGTLSGVTFPHIIPTFVTDATNHQDEAITLYLVGNTCGTDDSTGGNPAYLNIRPIVRASATALQFLKRDSTTAPAGDWYDFTCPYYHCVIDNEMVYDTATSTRKAMNIHILP